ncbi:fibropellin-1-like isoform X2 [Ruditapes philippinarum]|uniref:fibropellin-1-like isoform X2 n=1 Tax=Ruditapes philippinarum TaxID=129788 RepID=UPI00295B09A0|nr:fibropellin-1-like isoform X2 [Ruditapes philippinarum]
MAIFQRTFVLFALLVVVLHTSESNASVTRAKRQSPGKSSFGKSKGKITCIDDSECPAGDTCLEINLGTTVKSYCYTCNCMELNQCYLEDRLLLCNCSGSGFTGLYCETNIDDCENQPCMHDGTCIDKVNNYTCQCIPGYTGVNCETDIDDCENIICLNGGTCIDGVNTYNCDCAEGYTGQTCGTVIDVCDPNPCVSSAQCIRLAVGYTCACDPPGQISNTVVLQADSIPQSTCSPGYPNSYPINCNMQWYILAGENEKVQVEFTDFVTEKCCDRVYVKDATTQYCLGVLFGNSDEEPQYYISGPGPYDYVHEEYYQGVATKLSQPFVSSSNAMSISFYCRDSTVVYRGFCFTYKSIV